MCRIAGFVKGHISLFEDWREDYRLKNNGDAKHLFYRVEGANKGSNFWVVALLEKIEGMGLPYEPIL